MIKLNLSSQQNTYEYCAINFLVPYLHQFSAFWCKKFNDQHQRTWIYVQLTLEFKNSLGKYHPFFLSYKSINVNSFFGTACVLFYILGFLINTKNINYLYHTKAPRKKNHCYCYFI